MRLSAPDFSDVPVASGDEVVQMDSLLGGRNRFRCRQLRDAGQILFAGKEVVPSDAVG
jgi:hypothetical protein